MDFDSILFAKYLEGGGTQLKLFFDQTVSTWDGQAGNNFYCTDYISISKSPNKVVVEYDGTKYNCTKELDEEFGSYYYGAEYDAQNDTLDFSKYPFRAWFSDEDETLISLMAPDDQTHTFKIYEVKSGGGSSVDVEPLSVTENGTYEEEGKAYSPVDVNIPQPKMRKITVINNRNTLGNANDHITIYSFYIEEGLMKTSGITILPNITKDIYFPFAYAVPITPPSTTKSFYEFIARTNKNSSVPVFSDYITVSGSVIVGNARYSICQISDISQEIPDEITINVT